MKFKKSEIKKILVSLLGAADPKTPFATVSADGEKAIFIAGSVERWTTKAVLPTSDKFPEVGFSIKPLKTYLDACSEDVEIDFNEKVTVKDEAGKTSFNLVSAHPALIEPKEPLAKFHVGEKSSKFGACIAVSNSKDERFIFQNPWLFGKNGKIYLVGVSDSEMMGMEIAKNSDADDWKHQISAAVVANMEDADIAIYKNCVSISKDNTILYIPAVKGQGNGDAVWTIFQNWASKPAGDPVSLGELVRVLKKASVLELLGKNGDGFPTFMKKDGDGVSLSLQGEGSEGFSLHFQMQGMNDELVGFYAHKLIKVKVAETPLVTMRVAEPSKQAPFVFHEYDAKKKAPKEGFVYVVNAVRIRN